VLRIAEREARGVVRRARLRRRPLSVSKGDVAGALGGIAPREALRGQALAALPTVAELERRLETIGENERAEIVAVAERVAAHTFDLLGSGPTSLGPRIDWSRDFKSGRSWPVEHISRLKVSYPDHSDVKVPWELSRFQHLPVLAAAHRLTGERRWLDEIGAELADWIAANPVELGVNWLCTMDVAIRAANWIAALALVADAADGEPWFDAAIASLLLHGRFIRTHLEWAADRGNHYLSDVVGLLYVAALFAGSGEGRAWAEWAGRELVAELHYQVRDDGCDHEASIPYHRLVTELFVCGLQAAEALVPEAVTQRERDTLDRMLGFVADYTRPDGLAPQVGDADDGRFLPLDGYGRGDPRSHLHLFGQAGRARRPAGGPAAYPNGGYWIVQGGPLYALVRCGDVGVGGVGSHAHNDALSFELALGSQPLVVDPGAYLYTADPGERNRFRSTAFHSTLEIDGAEQNPLGDALFRLADVRRAEAFGWEVDAARAVFTGRHAGYERLSSPATHTRRIEVSRREPEVVVTDTVSSVGDHDLRWTFPLAPCQVEVRPGRAIASFASGAVLEVASDGVEFRVDDGWLSPSYGRREPAPFLRAHRRSRSGDDVTVFVLGARG
jgi:uncharacterized heparinase superfamily protein